MSEHTQVGPYALGLLDPLEMSRFEEHLAECDECATQLEWMLPVAGYMADVEPGDLFGIDGPSAFSAPEGSVQRPAARNDVPIRSARQAPPAPPPAAQAPLRELQTPQHPSELSPTAGPYSGEIPRIDPYGGEIPRIDPYRGEIPRIDPRTGEMPRIDPRTGSIPRMDPRTSRIPGADPRTGSIPRIDPRTGEIPRMDPQTGENRIVPLVRGGDPRRRPQARSLSHRPETAGTSRPLFRPALMIAAAAAVLGAAVGAGAMVAGPWANNTSSQTIGATGQVTGGDKIGAEKLAATDPGTGVHAAVSLDTKMWGTLISFTVSEVDGPRKCRLVADLADGKSQVLSSWTVPQQGYGEDTVPPELKLQAATALKRSDIAALRVQDITDAGDTTDLVTVRA